MSEPFDTSKINDPLMRVVYETMRDWRDEKLPAVDRLVFDLPAGPSAFFLALLQRIKQMHEDRGFELSSIVSHQTQEPMIRINWGDREGVFPPHQALLVANQLIEITQAAISDAFLYTFLLAQDLPQKAAWATLNAFREYRGNLLLRLPQPNEDIADEDRQSAEEKTTG